MRREKRTAQITLRQTRRATLVVCLLAGLARTASAEPITLRTAFQQFIPVEISGGTGEPIPGTGVTGPTCPDETSTSAPLIQSCAQSMAAGSATGFFSGTAQATGSLDGGLTLGDSVLLDVWSTGASSDLPYVASATATSTLNDSVTVLGAAEASGFLRLVFGVDGTVLEQLAGIGPNGTLLTADPGDYFQARESASLTANGVGATVTGGGPFTLDVPLLFGSPQDLTIAFSTTAGATLPSPGGSSFGYEILADFLHTSTLTNALILDSHGDPIIGASLLSAEGINYLQSPAASPVPEPATLTLVGAGLLFAGTRLRRARRATR
jgi:hypothetical protein